MRKLLHCSFIWIPLKLFRIETAENMGDSVKDTLDGAQGSAWFTELGVS